MYNFLVLSVVGSRFIFFVFKKCDKNINYSKNTEPNFI